MNKEIQVLQIHDGHRFVKRRLGFCTLDFYKQVAMVPVPGVLIPRWESGVDYVVGQYIEHDNKVWYVHTDMPANTVFDNNCADDLMAGVAVISQATYKRTFTSHADTVGKDSIYITLDPITDNPVWKELKNGMVVPTEYLYNQVDFYADLSEIPELVFIDFDHLGDVPIIHITDDINDDGYVTGSEVGNKNTLTVTAEVDHDNLIDGGAVEIIINGVGQNMVSLNDDGTLSVPGFDYDGNGVISWEQPFSEGETINIWAREFDKDGIPTKPGIDKAYVDTVFGEDGTFIPTITYPDDGNSDGNISNAEFNITGTEVVVTLKDDVLQRGGFVTIVLGGNRAEKTILLSFNGQGKLVDDDGDVWDYNAGVLRWKEPLTYTDTLVVDAMQTDKYGNPSRIATKAVFVEELDAFVNTPTVDLLPVSDTGDSDSDNITTDVLPKFGIGNIDSDVVKIACYIDDVYVGDAVNNGDGTASFDTTEPLLGDDHTFKAKVTDDNNNEATSDVLNFRIVNVIVDEVGVDNIVDLGSAGREVDVKGRVFAPFKEGDEIKLTFTDSTNNKTYVYTGAIEADLTFTVKVETIAIYNDTDKRVVAACVGKDFDGNNYGSDNEDDNGKFDWSAPPIDAPTLDLPAEYDTGDFDDDNITKETLPVIEIAGISPSVDKVEIFYGSVKYGDAVLNGDGTGTFTPTTPFSASTVWLRAVATTFYGVTVESPVLEFRVDTFASANIAIEEIGINDKIWAIDLDEIIKVKGRVWGDAKEGDTVKVQTNSGPFANDAENWFGPVDANLRFIVEIPARALAEDTDKRLYAYIEGTDLAGNEYQNNSTQRNYEVVDWFVGLNMDAIWDINKTDTLWQDVEGTIPVTEIGQEVARIDDISGNGYHLYRDENKRGWTYNQDNNGNSLVSSMGIESRFLVDVDRSGMTLIENVPGIGAWGIGVSASGTFNHSMSTFNDTLRIFGQGGLIFDANLVDETKINNQLSEEAFKYDKDTLTTLYRYFSRYNSFDWDISHWDVSNVTDLSFMFENASGFNAPIGIWDVSSVTNMSYMFSGSSDFNQPLNDWDVSSVTNMSYMFRRATNFNQPLNDWNVSNVTNMKYMFNRATNFNMPLDQWDVSKVTNMRAMFHEAKKFNQPLNSWNVSNVTSMRYMFYRTSSFNMPLDQWDVSNVTDMSSMFRDASIFNQNINSWDVSKVTNMSYMFSGSTSFNMPLDQWDVSNVTNMSYMFDRTTSFNMPLDQWDVSNVRNMSGMFCLTKIFNQPLNSWDVSSVRNMSYMFSGSTSFNQPLNDWDVSSVTNMSYMFYDTTSFNMPLDQWDVSNVTDMSSMFRITKIFNQPLNDWDVSSVRNMSYMFSGSTSFNQPLNDWDVSSVTNMSYMFREASSFNQPLNSWNVSSVTSMSYVFYEAINFNMPLDQWDVSKVTNMSFMFYQAHSFNQPLNSWNVSSVRNMSEMFREATSFNMSLDQWDVSKVTNMRAMFRGATSFDQDISMWCVSNISTKPFAFSDDSPIDGTTKMPVWGTCP